MVCSRVAPVADAYGEFLEMRRVAEELVSPELARLWQAPALQGAPLLVLASRGGDPWLRLVEDPRAGMARPFRRLGWMALEIAVADTDALAARLSGTPFRVVGGPGALELSPLIRATQVVGPAGEVLYLTQVDGDAPPFQLPRARSPVDRLFIPVLSVAQRERALAFYERIAGVKGVCVDTRISALNMAWGYRKERRHPVAVVQLAGESLVEIDQLPEPEPFHRVEGRLPPGIAMVSFALAGAEADSGLRFSAPLSGGRRAAVLRGADGEWVEIVAP